VDLAFGELLDRGKLANHVEELNVHLAMRTYFSGYQVTIADIAVFAALTSKLLLFCEEIF
jgi:glutathione S-transferase